MLMTFNSFYFLLCLFFILTISQSQTSWTTYSQFTGYLPPYTYPVTLNAGDTISGFMDWPNSNDLDLYIYKAGMDLISGSTYLVR